MVGEKPTNLSSEGGGQARAANAAAARSDDEQIVVVLPGVRDGRHLPVDEHLPRHSWVPNARDSNTTLGRGRNSERNPASDPEIWPGIVRSCFAHKSAPVILIRRAHESEGSLLSASFPVLPSPVARIVSHL